MADMLTDVLTVEASCACPVCGDRPDLGQVNAAVASGPVAVLTCKRCGKGSTVRTWFRILRILR
jgi:hypothetical protein